MSKYAAVNVKFGADISQFSTAMQNAVRQMQKAGDQLQQVGLSMTKNLTAPILALGAASLYAYGQIDQLKRGLTTFMGTTEAAEAEFQKLREVAKLPGIGLEEAVRGSNNLQAIGLSADDARKAMMAFGNAIATVGGGRENFELAIRGFGQLANAAKPLQQDLYQIANQLPQVNRLMIEAFGTNRAEDLAAMGITGKQLADFLVDALGKLPPVTGGIKNAFENLSDSAKVALGQIGEAIDRNFDISGKLSAFAEWLGRIAEGFSNLDPAIQGFILSAVAITAAVGPVMVAIGGIVKLLPIFAAGLSTIAGPVGILVALLVPLTVAIVGLATSTYDARTETEKLNEKIGEETQKAAVLFEQLKYTNYEHNRRKELIEQINSTYGTTLKNMRDETEFAQQLEKAYAKVVEQVEKKIRLEANSAELMSVIKQRIALEKQLEEAQIRGNEAQAKGITTLQTGAYDIWRKIEGLKAREMQLAQAGATIEAEAPLTSGSKGSGVGPKKFEALPEMQTKGIKSIYDTTATDISQGWEKINEAEFIGGEQFVKTANKTFDSYVQSFTRFINQIDVMIESFVENVIVDFAKQLGESLVNQENPFDSWGKNLLNALGGFMQQMGALFIAWGVNLAIFKDSLKSMNPYLAIAAGVALVGIGAAISASAKKGLEGSNSGSGGYTPRSTGGEDYTFTTRLDGRDLVLSGQRTSAIGRR